MGYTLIKNQPNRLGEFAASEASEFVSAIGNAVNGVVNSIFSAKVAIRSSKDSRTIAVTEAVEQTKRLGLQTTSATEQARIAADTAKTKYRTLPVVILTSGAALIGAIAIGAWAYDKIVGSYEIEYQ